MYLRRWCNCPFRRSKQVLWASPASLNPHSPNLIALPGHLAQRPACCSAPTAPNAASTAASGPSRHRLKKDPTGDRSNPLLCLVSPSLAATPSFWRHLCTHLPIIYLQKTIGAAFIECQLGPLMIQIRSRPVTPSGDRLGVLVTRAFQTHGQGVTIAQGLWPKLRQGHRRGDADLWASVPGSAECPVEGFGPRELGEAGRHTTHTSLLKLSGKPPKPSPHQNFTPLPPPWAESTPMRPLRRGTIHWPRPPCAWHLPGRSRPASEGPRPPLRRCGPSSGSPWFRRARATQRGRGGGDRRARRGSHGRNGLATGR